MGMQWWLLARWSSAAGGLAETGLPPGWRAYGPFATEPEVQAELEDRWGDKRLLTALVCKWSLTDGLFVVDDRSRELNSFLGNYCNWDEDSINTFCVLTVLPGYLNSSRPKQSEVGA